MTQPDQEINPAQEIRDQILANLPNCYGCPVAAQKAELIASQIAQAELSLRNAQVLQQLGGNCLTLTTIFEDIQIGLRETYCGESGGDFREQYPLES